MWHLGYKSQIMADVVRAPTKEYIVCTSFHSEYSVPTTYIYNGQPLALTLITNSTYQSTFIYQFIYTIPFRMGMIT